MALSWENESPRTGIQDNLTETYMDLLHWVPLTTSSVTMSTRLQWVGFFASIIDSNVKKFGYCEHPLRTSSFLFIYLLVISGTQSFHPGGGGGGNLHRHPFSTFVPYPPSPGWVMQTNVSPGRACNSSVYILHHNMPTILILKMLGHRDICICGCCLVRFASPCYAVQSNRCIVKFIATQKRIGSHQWTSRINVSASPSSVKAQKHRRFITCAIIGSLVLSLLKKSLHLSKHCSLESRVWLKL